MTTPTLTIERLFAAPALAGSLPTHVRLAPDGSRVTFLRPAADDRERLDLWCLDVASSVECCLINSADIAAAATLTEEEKARRERRRVFARGIVEYEWTDDASRILFPLDGVVYAFDIATGAHAQLSPAKTQQTDVQLAPGGQYVAYVRDGDLYVFTLETQTELRITHDGSETVSNGLAEFIAQEEMHRFDGFWWSPDGKQIAFTRVDTSAIPVSWRYDINADGTVAVAQRYPYAGASNAQVQLWVVALATPRLPVLISWQHTPEDYLARVHWAPDSEALLVQRQSRNQQQLALLFVPVDGTAARTLLTEASTTWLNLHDNLRIVGATRFLWTSERDGRAQLYVGSFTGSLAGELRQVTHGNGMVTQVLGTDKTSTHAYVLGWVDDPTQQHLYAIDLTSGAFTRHTQAPGWHQCVIAKDASIAIDTWSNSDQPPRIDLLDLRTQQSRPLVANEIVQGHPYFPFAPSHPQVSFGELAADDGQRLCYRLTCPVHFNPTRAHPVLINVYGGPGVTRVRQEWLPVWHHFLSRQGFVIFELDNRGSALRGPAFEAPIFGRLGEVEVRDQLIGLRWLQQQAFVDAQRIAVAGHSYGGYMTLMMLAKAPGQFAAGIATAPVSDWALYDTHYTERYLGTPQANADGYARSNLLHCLPALRDPLLLMHGMADDNVLFTHTTRILSALHAHGTQFDLMTYPGAKHGLAERAVSVHRYTMMHRFLLRHLPEAPVVSANNSL